MTDTLVIGGGVAGMTAALASAEKGEKVTLLTYGEGTLPLNSGVIDILGYDNHHKLVENPFKAIDDLPKEHPYQRIGKDGLKQAVEFFLKTAEKYHLPYHGSLEQQMMVPTAAGTLKPTGFAPHSLAGSEVMSGKSKIVLVGIKGLKDFYTETMLDNFKKSLGEDKSYEVIEVDTGLKDGRDIIGQDVARWLDTESGADSFASQLKGKADTNTVFIMPQILGTAGHEIYLKLKSKIGAELLETTSLPPSVNGMRLKNVLVQAMRDAGVKIIHNTQVLRAECTNGKCTAVVAKTAAREKRYEAKKFILATGGFYSGGLVMTEFEQPKETVFDLPVYFIKGEENWSNEKLFADKPQGFAQTGIMTDSSMRPVDDNGKVVLENVYAVGRALGGYDFCFEHSGNGVAIGSAYKAAMM